MSSGTSNTTVAAAPWAALPPKLCGLVVDRLDAMSVLKFPSVCKNWSTACREPPRLQSGSPTLLVTSCLDGDDYDSNSFYDYVDGIFALHDVSTGRSFPAEAEGLRDRCWVGGKDAWLVTAGTDCTVELLHPVTGARTRLPSFDTIPGVKLMNGEFQVQVEGETYAQMLQRVVLCRTPGHCEGYLAVAMFSGNLLAFTRFGDESWTVLKNPCLELEGARIIRYADTIVHEDKVIAVTQSGGVYSWQISMGGNNETSSEMVREPDPQEGSRFYYLAKSRGGRILLVCMSGRTSWYGLCVRRKIFDCLGQQACCFQPSDVALYELHTSDGTWRQVSGIGTHHALFLGANYPFYVTLPRGDLKANCIYVADMDSSHAAVIDLNRRGQDSFFERIDYPGDFDAFQIPMWFRPTAYSIYS